MTTLQKTAHKGYYKDDKTGAVINNNNDEFSLYMNQVQQYKEFQKMKNQISALSSDVEIIKQLLGKN